MLRRGFLLLILGAWVLPGPIFADGDHERVRGHLVQTEGKPPMLRLKDGSMIQLEGDAPSLDVANDPRLAKEDFEAVGHYDGPGRFRIDPIHLRGLFVYRNGKRLVVTYWCDICSIRTYSPGKCVCCQNETSFDPRDPALRDEDPTR